MVVSNGKGQKIAVGTNNDKENHDIFINNLLTA
jgi:hypothetical protein